MESPGQLLSRGSARFIVQHILQLTQYPEQYYKYQANSLTELHSTVLQYRFVIHYNQIQDSIRETFTFF